MTPPPDDHQSVWQAINAWSETLAPWQRCILAFAVRGGMLTDEQIDAVYDRFLQDTGLKDSDGQALPTVDVSGRPAERLTKPLLLESITELAGINALPDGASLSFGRGLTVIYGRNGAGKSGFARLIANACFSRQRPSILGNIFTTAKQSQPAAKICLSVDDAQQVVPFSPGTEHADLRRISVFDTAVARHHVSQTAPFEFRPAGFDVFPEMVRVYGILSAKLEADAKSRIVDTDFSTSFIGAATAVSKAVADLNPTTDLSALRALAVYGPTEQARLEDVGQQITSLQAHSAKETIAQLRQASTDLKALAAKLSSLSKLFDSDRAEFRSKLSSAARRSADMASALGSEQFQRPFFRAIGSTEWQEFAKAAHTLARQESATYPDHGDRCLLCERPYDEASHTHVKALLAFVEGDAQREAADAANALHTEISNIEAIDTDFFTEDSRVRLHIHRLDPSVERSVEASIAALAQGKSQTLAALHERAVVDVTVSTAAVQSELARLVASAESDIERLEKDDPSSAIQSLDLERQSLRHKEVLSKLLPAIEKQVQGLAWNEKARSAKASLSPRHITETEKDLFAQIIGHDYRSRFAHECKELECALPVELQTAGQKGKTVRSLTMKGGYSPERVLSEGEQRAIALADFLTEVGLNPANAGIVLDDPVTSLDHQRKECIATRLVREARSRQVVIFTHDLVFLNQLVTQAEKADTDLQTHWVDRHNGGAPGYVTHNDAPVTSKAYDTTEKAKACLAKAKTVNGTSRHEQIMLGMGALRRTIEEAIVKRLLKGVVPRWSDRVIVTGLRKIAWDDSIADALVTEFEELSTFIEGHSHTDEATGAPPDLRHLEEKISAIDALIKRAKPERRVEKTTGGAQPA